jgi:hypothetical protein
MEPKKNGNIGKAKKHSMAGNRKLMMLLAEPVLKTCTFSIEYLRALAIFASVITLMQCVNREVAHFHHLLQSRLEVTYLGSYLPT